MPVNPAVEVQALATAHWRTRSAPECVMLAHAGAAP